MDVKPARWQRAGGVRRDANMRAGRSGTVSGDASTGAA
jgi:hypothetical protein